jgi:hypothetical protein
MPMRVIAAVLFMYVLLGMSITPLSAEDEKPKMTLLYPDTADGLRDFVQAFIQVIKASDLEKRSRIEESLRIPEPRKWFEVIYGPQVGRQKADSYIGNPPELYPYVDNCNLDAPMKVRVSRVAFRNERDAKLSGIPLLQSMRNPLPFYTVYFAYDNGGLCLIDPVFVYVQQGFRALRRDRKIDDHSRPYCGLQRLLLKRYYVGEGTMRAKLLSPASSEPFPPDGSQQSARTETLLISIACDGSVLETDYLDRPPQFFGQAAAIVRKWKYRRTIMDGVPAEVYTTATVSLAPSK